MIVIKLLLRIIIGLPIGLSMAWIVNCFAYALGLASINGLLPKNALGLPMVILCMVVSFMTSFLTRRWLIMAVASITPSSLVLYQMVPYWHDVRVILKDFVLFLLAGPGFGVGFGLVMFSIRQHLEAGLDRLATELARPVKKATLPASQNPERTYEI